MPKGILEFNLPEEREEFELAKNGSSYSFVIWDLDQHLRSLLKYNGENHSQEILNELQKVRDKLHELLNDCDLSI